MMQPSSNTLTSLGIGAPAAVILVWAFQAFFNIEVPSSVEVAFGAIFSSAVGYFTEFMMNKAKASVVPGETV